MALPKDWISQVKMLFTGGRPNGMLLQWDIDRFFAELKAVCNSHRVKNISDFNYAYCNTYIVMPPQPLESKRIFEATISFSFICNAYSLHWTSYSPDKRRGKVVPETVLPKSLENPTGMLRKFAEDNGFKEIECEWMDIQVEGVELELADVATLGKCLFDDF